MVRCSVVSSEKMDDFVVKDLKKAPKPLPVDDVASNSLCIFRKFFFLSNFINHLLSNLEPVFQTYSTLAAIGNLQKNRHLVLEKGRGGFT